MPDLPADAPGRPARPKARRWLGYARTGMHGVLQVAPLRWSVLRLAVAFPSAARAIAARTGYLPTVDMHLIVARPPQWKIEPDPAALEAWRRLVRER